MNEIHKLATIIFADIAGYTALMQNDEAQALESLARFKSTLERETTLHTGQIVQYFGDGCLLSFESTTKAVNCAIALQIAFRSLPEIPVRIGMHLGEVVYKDENVFGDGVNIASRIESLGIPGAILMSRSVRDQIKNKSDFLLVSLGTFEFKNVEEPSEVFALANPGFVVPRRQEMQGKLKTPVTKSRQKWTLSALIIVAALIAFGGWYLGKDAGSPLSKDVRERPVAVMPFENQTMNDKLDAFGLMAMDWISQSLLESGDAHVVKEEGVSVAGSGNETQIPEGAEILIRGRYYSTGADELTVTVEVFDTRSSTVLYALTPQTGQKNDPMAVLYALQQEILGYWNLDGTFLGKQPPRYDAYEAYMQAITTVEQSPYPKKKSLLRKATTLDSDFVEPLFYSIEMSMWGFLPEHRDSIMQVIKGKQHLFSDYQKLKWEGIQAQFSGDYTKRAELEWQLYEEFKMDDAAQRAIEFYRLSNHLSKTIQLYNQFEPATSEGKSSHTLGRAIGALYDLGEYEKVYQMIEEFPHKITSIWCVVTHLTVLAKLEKWDELDEKLAFYKTEPIRTLGEYHPAALLWALCNELYVTDRMDMLPKYQLLHEEWLNEQNGEGMFYYSDLGMLYYLKGEYQKAYENSLRYVHEQNIDWATEVPGVCLMKMGKEKEAEEYMEYLKDKYNETLPGQLDYALGAIEAQRDKALGVEYLRKSVEKGFEFDWNCYRHDPVLKELLDYPAFMTLTQPK